MAEIDTEIWIIGIVMKSAYMGEKDRDERSKKIQVLQW